jgi:hypothetical protein
MARWLRYWSRRTFFRITFGSCATLERSILPNWRKRRPCSALPAAFSAKFSRGSIVTAYKAAAGAMGAGIPASPRAAISISGDMGCYRQISSGPAKSAFTSVNVRMVRDTTATPAEHMLDCVTLGTMTPILFLDQPDPDWLLAESVLWLTSVDQQPRLELTLRNLSAQRHPGADVGFGVMRLFALCAVSSGSAQIDLLFSFARGVLSIASGDPQFSEPIDRKVVFTRNPCGLNGFEADLGPTGAIEAGQIFRIRYRFPIKVSVGNVENHSFRNRDLTTGLNPGSQIDVARLLELGNRSVRLSGDRVYPAVNKVEVH